jgi:hypothetical protein
MTINDMNIRNTDSRKRHLNLQVNRQVCTLCGWPTDIASIDYYGSTGTSMSTSTHDATPPSSPSSISLPHTIFMFVPGNPGCIGWYIDMLYSVVQKLGVGYAARAVSYAGHGVGKDMIQAQVQGGKNLDGHGNGHRKRKSAAERIALTVDGQVEHKIEWTDMITSEMIALRRKMSMDSDYNVNGSDNSSDNVGLVKYIFITHSIGAHLVQRMLLLRRDILLQSNMIVHLTPFYRYDPSSKWTKNFLSTVANAPQSITLLKSISYVISHLPPKLIDLYLQKVSNIPLEKDRTLARELYSQPTYARNFLELGSEEIREVPEIQDDNAMRVIGKFCPTAILYCPNDHWAPLFHMHDIKQAQREKRLPANITVECNEDILHGFIVFPKMIPTVVDFIIKSVTNMNISMMGDDESMIRSKL